ncbi:MAG: hypothetical protein ACC645_24615, partial [Pirellulales bacterium]
LGLGTLWHHRIPAREMGKKILNSVLDALSPPAEQRDHNSAASLPRSQLSTQDAMEDGTSKL